VRAPAKEGIRVKKQFFALVLCALLAVPAVPASANSGPETMEQSPSFAITPLADCPITVAKENLTFDFPSDQGSGFSPQAQVTAAYSMRNPTAKDTKVQMAFPLIASLEDLSKMDGIRITGDGKPIPFQIFIGQACAPEGVFHNYYDKNGGLVKTNLPSFDSILKSVSAHPADRKIVTGTGKAYQITSANENGVTVSGTAGMFLLASGFNDYSDRDGTFTLAGKTSQSLSFLTLGSGNPVIVPADPNAGTKIDSSVQNPDSYFLPLAEESAAYRAYPSAAFRDRLVSALEDSAEACFQRGNHVYVDAERYGFFDTNRILVLCYEADFPAGSTRDISVSYPMGGSMNLDSAWKPIYSYGYLLNPAKGWAGFQNLSIRVTPPKNAPELIRSSLALKKEGNAYTADFSGLPNGDLVFTLQGNGPARPNPSGSNGWNILTQTLAVIAVLGLALLEVRYLVRRHKRKVN
jgi:hypothetical protein